MTRRIQALGVLLVLCVLMAHSTGIVHRISHFHDGQWASQQPNAAHHQHHGIDQHDHHHHSHGDTLTLHECVLLDGACTAASPVSSAFSLLPAPQAASLPVGKLGAPPTRSIAGTALPPVRAPPSDVLI